MGKYAVIDPATRTVVTAHTDATDVEVEIALSSAHETYNRWSRRTTVAERAQLVGRAAELLRERVDEFAAIINREMGKPVADGREEVLFSADIMRTFAQRAEEWLADEEIKAEDGLRTVIRRQGIGVILGIMPWNYPVYQVARFAAPNLIVGNTVIVKHANQCPDSALALEALFRDAGFPDGAYVNVFATHDHISTIIADDRVQGVSLTGSERAGAIVAEQAGRHLKKCVLELGGSDPFIVLDTEDLDAAVRHAVWGRMKNSGQSCTGSKRFIIIDRHYEEFAGKFTQALSTQSRENGDYGPLASDDATSTLVAQVQGAIDQGAELVVGDNTPDGNFYRPGVLVNISPQMDVYSEELFGPVAQLYRVSSDEEAIELANSSPYGLGSVVICDDLDRAERVGEQLDVGMVYVNAAGLDGADVPFGGVKKSGFGRELGRLGIDEFTNKKIYRYGR